MNNSKFKEMVVGYTNKNEPVLALKIHEYSISEIDRYVVLPNILSELAHDYKQEMYRSLNSKEGENGMSFYKKVYDHARMAKKIAFIEHHFCEASRHSKIANEYEESDIDTYEHHDHISEMHYETAMNIISENKLSDKLDILRDRGFEMADKKGKAEAWSSFTDLEF